MTRSGSNLPPFFPFAQTLFPWIIMTKKRYVGLLYEDDPDATPKLKYMGIALKRRDNAPICKTVFKSVLDAILYNRDVHQGVASLRDHLDAIKAGRVNVKELIVSKTLRAEYKDPTRIAHKVLAERMGERDPGNKPACNERIPYIYVKRDAPPGVKLLQGDMIESPAYALEHNLTPDYGFYITNQIMVPVTQLLALALDKLPGFRAPPGENVASWTEARRLVETQYLLFQPYRETPLPGCCALVRADKKEAEAAKNRPPPGPTVRVAKDGTWRFLGADGTLLAKGDSGAGSSKDSDILRQLRGVNAAFDAALTFNDIVPVAVVAETAALHKILSGQNKVCKGGEDLFEDIKGCFHGVTYWGPAPKK